MGRWFLKHWCGLCARGGEGKGGRRGGAFKGLEPEFPLPGTVGFSKTDLKRFDEQAF